MKFHKSSPFHWLFILHLHITIDPRMLTSAPVSDLIQMFINASNRGNHKESTVALSFPELMCFCVKKQTDKLIQVLPSCHLKPESGSNEGPEPQCRETTHKPTATVHHKVATSFSI